MEWGGKWRRVRGREVGGVGGWEGGGVGEVVGGLGGWRIEGIEWAAWDRGVWLKA